MSSSSLREASRATSALEGLGGRDLMGEAALPEDLLADWDLAGLPLRGDELLDGEEALGLGLPGAGKAGLRKSDHSLISS